MVKNSSHPISMILLDANKKKQFENISMATSKHHIFNLAQLTYNKGTTMMTWKQTKFAHNIKSRGRPYRWFASLENAVIDRAGRSNRNLIKDRAIRPEWDIIRQPKCSRS